MFFSNAVWEDTSKEDRHTCADVTELVMPVNEYAKKFFKRPDSIDFECHSVCRAIATLLNTVKVVDGHLLGITQKEDEASFHFSLKFCDHSWLVTKSGTIIDPYPMGILCGTPLLICTRGKYASCAAGHYVKDFEVTQRISTSRIYRKSVVLAEFIREASKSRTPP